jgi:hypothetical protein
MICTYLNSHLLAAPCKYVPHGLVTGFGLSLFLVSLSKHASCYHAQPSILLFISVVLVSHQMPSSLSGWLLTNVQVNNITTLHDTHGHRYIHHIGITILLFFLHFFQPSWQAGWFRLSRLTQLI